MQRDIGNPDSNFYRAIAIATKGEEEWASVELNYFREECEREIENIARNFSWSAPALFAKRFAPEEYTQYVQERLLKEVALEREIEDMFS